MVWPTKHGLCPFIYCSGPSLTPFRLKQAQFCICEEEHSSGEHRHLFLHVWFTTRTSVRFDWHQWTSEQLMSIINFHQDTHQPFWNCVLIFHLSVRNGYFHICHVMQGISVKIVMISRKKVCFQFGFDYFLELGRTEDRGGGFMGGEAHPSLPFYPTNNFCTYMAYMYAYMAKVWIFQCLWIIVQVPQSSSHIYHALQISF